MSLAETVAQHLRQQPAHPFCDVCLCELWTADPHELREAAAALVQSGEFVRGSEECSGCGMFRPTTRVAPA